MKAIFSCREATRLMSEQLDHPLPYHKRILLKVHLAMCRNCIFFGRQIKALKNIIGKYANLENAAPSPYTSSLSDDACRRIKSMMK